MIFCINGKFLPARQARISVLDNGFLYGDGFYDTMRVYDGVVFELEAHLKRIASSAQKMALVLPWPMPTIGAWIKTVSARNRLTEARIRVTISRGIHGIQFGIERRPTLVITCEKVTVNRAVSAKGIDACTLTFERLWPGIKTIGMTGMILAARSVAPYGASEVICIGEKNRVREGAFTNVFIVNNGRLLTPKNGIFPGLTRHRVLALARRADLPVLMKDLPRSALGNADEIFLTNRVREIIPIVRLNGKKVGTGRVGPMTKKLMVAYREYVRKYVERHTSDVAHLRT